MDKAEARTLLEGRIAKLRHLSYDEIVGTYLLDQPAHREPTWEEIVAPSGTRYAIKLYAYWDDAESGDVRMFANIDDGSLLRFMFPLSECFIIAPDGRFVGE